MKLVEELSVDAENRLFKTNVKRLEKSVEQAEHVIRTLEQVVPPSNERQKKLIDNISKA